MARRGFFGRVRQVLHAVFPIIPEKPRRAPSKPKKRAAPTTPPPTPPRAPDPYEQAWTEETLRRSGTRDYNAARNFASNLYGWDRLDDDEKLYVWREFLKFNQRGPRRRNDPRHRFWTVTGIHPDNFDWHGWREAMNYPHGRRTGRYA